MYITMNNPLIFLVLIFPFTIFCPPKFFHFGFCFISLITSVIQRKRDNLAHENEIFFHAMSDLI